MAGASDNGGWPPDGGANDDLPDLPEEWGVIVIPDDLSELSEEVEAVRAELNTAVPLTGWQRFARRPAVRRLRRLGALTIRTPALIISMAVLVTVASLFASAWPGPSRQPATQRTASTSATPSDKLPALDLIGTNGQAVSIRNRLPAVIILTDGCACESLVTDTIASVKSDTAVIAVSSAAASVAPSAGLTYLPQAQTPQADGKSVSFLRDPTGGLRRHFQIGAPDGTAAVLIADKSGKIVRLRDRIASVEEIRPDLARL
ncbi:hypothetical protein FB565_005498 [Actinoplanes lutulentus]|uniref:Uncharacterized protein n=1 Tax=Actinoplanes lutulentus TaxID=1287878 RepID=A0A327ZCZ8_9ACTN|nr:hypothetical protein [Actinoplanes lutulentus]MBB2945740.1 hypothetical protein [Actinoplanes lutulentus]RAK37789.1 hypothetical protein B0I29_10655 [Actinoplanes lutulentus]